MKLISLLKFSSDNGLRVVLFVSTVFLAMPLPLARSAELIPDDIAASDHFGISVSVSGTTGLVGAENSDIGGNADQGSAYLFRELNTASGTVTQNAKLTASDGATSAYFGRAVSLSGNSALSGAWGANSNQGAAYLYRDLDTATGNVTQNARLAASDGSAGDFLGYAVALSGSIGLAGAYGVNSNQGAAYLFRNLHTASGNVTENAKLVASDQAAGNYFGWAVALSGNLGVVGAHHSTVGGNSSQGAAYVFHNLDTATGNVTQNVKLLADDGTSNNFFGISVAVSGNNSLVGAAGVNSNQGAAYLFRNLDTASGNMTQDAKLVGSDTAAGDYFGYSVSISGTLGIVGAYRHDVASNSDQGAAYLYQALDSATGVVTEVVKLLASDGAAGDRFGRSVSIDGDRILIGAYEKNTGQGQAYSGTFRTFVTSDLGNDATETGGLSFISREHWIIGNSSDNNTVTLTAGDTANVTFSGKGVYVGKNSGSDLNKLVVSNGANLTAGFVQVGVSGGTTTGNELKVNGSLLLSSGGNVTIHNQATLSGNGTIIGGDLYIDGSLAPGNSIGMMTVNTGNVTWNSNNPWVFELGSASSSLMAASTSNTTQDLLMITSGNFIKGSGTTFTFDFVGTGAAGWYKLVDWSGTTSFAAGDFAATNLPGGYTASFTVDGGTSALYVTLTPEPSTFSLLLLALAGYTISRRRPKT